MDDVAEDLWSNLMPVDGTAAMLAQRDAAEKAEKDAELQRFAQSCYDDSQVAMNLEKWYGKR